MTSGLGIQINDDCADYDHAHPQNRSQVRNLLVEQRTCESNENDAEPGPQRVSNAKRDGP